MQYSNRLAGRLGFLLLVAGLALTTMASTALAGGATVEIIDDLPGIAHGLVDLEVQEAFRETTIEWLRRRVPGRRN